MADGSRYIPRVDTNGHGLRWLGIFVGQATLQYEFRVHPASEFNESLNGRHGVGGVKRFFKAGAGVGAQPESPGRLADGGWMEVG